MADYLYDTINRLVAFDTVSANSNLEAAQFLADRLDRAGFKTTLQKVEIFGVPHANLIAWAGPPVRDGLMVSGHIDTVPFDGQPGWTREPLKADLDGDRLYGRGTSDMKGFIAQCIDATLKLDQKMLRRPLVLVFTADEEVGCRGAELVGPKLGGLLGELPMPELCWIGEPTSYGICHTHKSIGSFEVKVLGRGGHSGAPTQGVNAIAVMGKVMDVIGKLQQERASSPIAEFVEAFPEAPNDVLNFGTISGGLALNMIAEECRLRIGAIGRFRTWIRWSCIARSSAASVQSTRVTGRAEPIARPSRLDARRSCLRYSRSVERRSSARSPRRPAQRPRAARPTAPTAGILHSRE